MNHSYRLVWNDAHQRYVPASETARGHGKGRVAKALAPVALLLSAALALPCMAQPAPPVQPDTLPTGFASPNADVRLVEGGPGQMTIVQTSPRAIIQWQSFDIGQSAHVKFQQPDADAVTLNRVMADNASQIHGQLTANGQVWLVNPNGVVFGEHSRVNVGGLVASALNTTDADFLSNHAVFTRSPGANGAISNQGEISAADGGLVALLAPTVLNERMIRVKMGNVVLAAGDQVTLEAGVNGLLQVAVEPATVATLVENRQLITADGGQVLMTSKAADALSGGVVSNTGTVQARTLTERDGRIVLLADMQHGEVQLAGTLQAQSVDTSAAAVRMVPQLVVNAEGGHWRMSQQRATVDQNEATAIRTALAHGNVTVAATTEGRADPDAGGIDVNAGIAYAGRRLALNADSGIRVNAPISVGGDGTLDLNYGGTAGDPHVQPVNGSNLVVTDRVNFEQGGDGLLRINGHAFTVLHGVDALQAMDTGRNYVLGSAIEAGNTQEWNGGAGFQPVGTEDQEFTGTFDGLGHAIKGLTIHRGNEDHVGLFGATRNATLRNVQLDGGSVTGRNQVGALVGSQQADNGMASVSYVKSTAQVTGGMNVGGLVGSNTSQQGIATIHNVRVQARVAGGAAVGGLVGMQEAAQGGLAWIHTASADEVTVAGSGSVGGLVGLQTADSAGTSIIQRARATGEVFGREAVGGLVGAHETDTEGCSHISNAYAIARVEGTEGVGGLVGLHTAETSGTSSLVDVYANGAVVSTQAPGGLLVGRLVAEGGHSHITHAYAVGTVGGAAQNGRLAGSVEESVEGTGLIEHSFYAITGIPGEEIHPDQGRTLAQLQDPSTFAGWQMDDQGGTGRTWRIYPGATTPLLRDFLRPVTATAQLDPGHRTKVYDGQRAHHFVDYTTDVPGAVLQGALHYQSNSKNVGVYSLEDRSLFLGGLSSDQQGYDIRYAMHEPVSITPATLALHAAPGRKEYDGTRAAAGEAEVVGLMPGDFVTAPSQAFDSPAPGLRWLHVNHDDQIHDGNNGGNYRVDRWPAPGRIDEPFHATSGGTSRRSRPLARSLFHSQEYGLQGRNGANEPEVESLLRVDAVHDFSSPF